MLCCGGDERWCLDTETTARELGYMTSVEFIKWVTWKHTGLSAACQHGYVRPPRVWDQHGDTMHMAWIKPGLFVALTHWCPATCVCEVRVMASCRLFGARPLPKPMTMYIVNCIIGNNTGNRIWIIIYKLSRKCIGKVVCKTTTISSRPQCVK